MNLDFRCSYKSKNNGEKLPVLPRSPTKESSRKAPARNRNTSEDKNENELAEVLKAKIRRGRYIAGTNESTGKQ